MSNEFDLNLRHKPGMTAAEFIRRYCEVFRPYAFATQDNSLNEFEKLITHVLHIMCHHKRRSAMVGLPADPRDPVPTDWGSQREAQLRATIEYTGRAIGKALRLAEASNWHDALNELRQVLPCTEQAPPVNEPVNEEAPESEIGKLHRRIDRCVANLADNMVDERKRDRARFATLVGQFNDLEAKVDDCTPSPERMIDITERLDRLESWMARGMEGVVQDLREHDFESSVCGDDDEVYTVTLQAGDKLSPSEALYGFASWLTCRGESLQVGAPHDAAPMAELVGRYCKLNELSEPRKGWPNLLMNRRRG